jgi:hypothetical protein
MTGLDRIHRLIGNLAKTWLLARRQPREQPQPTAWLHTLEGCLEIERLLGYPACPADTTRKPRRRPRPAVDTRRDWQRSTCWDLEEQIYARLVSTAAPGQFAECIPRDWETLTKRARTGEQRQLCRRGAAVRARKELGCRSRGWRRERRVFRRVVRGHDNDTPLDGLAPQQPTTFLNGMCLGGAELEEALRTPAPPPGPPPPAKRVNRTRTRSNRRGGHGGCCPPSRKHRAAGQAARTVVL